MAALLMILAMTGTPAGDLRREVHEGLRAWARPTDSQLPEAAQTIWELYGRVDRDTTLAASSRKELRLKLRARLAAFADRLRPLGQRLEPTAPGPAPARDHAQELIDLIQQTIAPKSWDVNGGPGAIRFWRPGLALVITQTDEIHGQVSGLAEQLRRD